MPKAQQYRWVCDNPKHPGVLASSRPRRDDVRRFCWACSQANGRLVERHCPALDKARAAKQERRTKENARQNDRLRLQHLARVSYGGVNLEAELARLWKLDCIQDAVRVLGRDSPCKPVPSLHVRHASKRPRRWGFAQPSRHHIHLTLWPGAKIEDVLGTLAHEVAHMLDYVKHGYRTDDSGRNIHHDDLYYDCRDAVAIEAYGRDGWAGSDDRFVDACTVVGVEIARDHSGVDMSHLPKLGVHGMEPREERSWTEAPGCGYFRVSGQTATELQYAFDTLIRHVQDRPTGDVTARDRAAALRKLVRFTGRRRLTAQLWWTYANHKVALWLCQEAESRSCDRVTTYKLEQLERTIADTVRAYEAAQKK